MDSTAHEERQLHYLKDYKSPDFSVSELSLVFNLDKTKTIVESMMEFTKINNECQDLVLLGEKMELLSISLNDNDLEVDQYEVSSGSIRIMSVPSTFNIKIKVLIDPSSNKTLNGLYVSNNNFATQCEPHGFRRITYFLDRPDVLTKFKVKIVANKNDYPVLLSNGDMTGSGNYSDGMHWAEWSDPTLKPCYLFALVAGKFEFINKEFVTSSGRKVDLRVYVEPGKIDQAEFALYSLEQAMIWDQDTYDREYDLNTYMIVAVSDFNFGAMENKGLNIFNDQYVLTNHKLATDQDFTNTLGVIGHEYFHNWSGNRVTCRDWFQLSLKEGLTIFRDQSFTADMTSGNIKRLGDVNVIKNVQFAEDAGPMSHPVRPSSYVSMNNFYTTTVYNKGSELIRMIRLILGEQNFYSAMNIYFANNDGSAVTTDDFVTAMEQGSNLDLTQFRRWYDQAGTPLVSIVTEYDYESSQLIIEMEQTFPNNEDNLALHIPISFALFDSAGIKMDVRYNNFNPSSVDNVIHLTELKSRFVIDGVEKKPIISWLRNFSAPVKIHYYQDNSVLCFLMQYEDDIVNLKETIDKVAFQVISDKYKSIINNDEYEVPQLIIDAYQVCISKCKDNKELLQYVLEMPSIKYLLLEIKNADVHILIQAQKYLLRNIVGSNEQALLKIYHDNNLTKPYEFNVEQTAARSAKNSALIALNVFNKEEYFNLAFTQFNEADNMTDKISSIQAIINSNNEAREIILESFYNQYKDYPLVIDKWFRLQASRSVIGTSDTVKSLMNHPDFNMQNPNRVRALLGTFANLNMLCFHNVSGIGYVILADAIIKIDKYNPQLASRLCEPLACFKLYDNDRQIMMQEQLKRIMALPNLSDDVFEVINRSLNASI